MYSGFRSSLIVYTYTDNILAMQWMMDDNILLRFRSFICFRTNRLGLSLIKASVLIAIAI